jgi:DNA (cytosine-5)-methyltransferase 1
MLPGTPASWAKAMGIDWMTPRELSQAIPPSYTEFVGRQFIRVVAVAA